jgi:hypothetical protein
MLAFPAAFSALEGMGLLPEHLPTIREGRIGECLVSIFCARKQRVFHARTDPSFVNLFF